RQPSCRCISSFGPKHLIGRIGARLAGKQAKAHLVSRLSRGGLPLAGTASEGAGASPWLPRDLRLTGKQCRPAEVLRSARTVSEGGSDSPEARPTSWSAPSRCKGIRTSWTAPACGGERAVVFLCLFRD
ncbi:hypothetical protein PSTT_02557, partial [Puccinia striiformis]